MSATITSSGEGRCTSRRGPKVKELLALDFHKPSDVNCLKSIGLEDGCISCEGGVLNVNSARFARMAEIDTSSPELECETRRSAWLDNFHLMLRTEKCVPLERCRETVLSTRMATEVFLRHQKNTSIPTAYLMRVNNITADPRLAHGSFSVLAPETGITAGFLQTNNGLHAFYGRLAYAAAQQDCGWLVPCGAGRCSTCKPETFRYNADNFWEDISFQLFKRTSTYRDWLHFQQYARWRSHCDGQGFDHCDWKRYGLFCDEFGYPTCDTLDHHGGRLYVRDNWISWSSWRDYHEYALFQDYMNWKDLEFEFGRGRRSSCSGGCAPKVNYSLPGLGKCVRPGCSSCQSCAVASEPETTVTLVRETYSYQYGAIRCCCDSVSASFLSLIELTPRGACDPALDFQCLSIGLDPSHSTITWYINNTKVYQHVGIGRRTLPAHIVREHGGYAEDVSITRVLPLFGTGSLMDATLPVGSALKASVHQDPSTGNYVNRTALVQLLELKSYMNTLPNRFGEIGPVEASFFGSAGNVAANQNIGSPTSAPYRLFGQGAVARFIYLNAFSRRTSQGYVWIPKNCREIYGPVVSERGCRSHLCGPRKERCGTKWEDCCGRNCDEVSSDEDCCSERSWEASFVPAGGVPVILDNESPMGCVRGFPTTL